MLELQDIHTYYGESYVLQGVSLRVAEGQVAAVLGRNGVGKTTMFRSIMGLTPPRRGRIVFQGTDVSGLPPHRIARLGMALVPQGRHIFPSLTVRENLEVAERRSGQDKAPGKGWSLGGVMDLFPRLREREQHGGTKLSGGEQQMLACGRALVANPTLLLMDEPTEGLAPVVVRELERLILQLKTEGVSILLAEQRFGFALRVADYVYIMSQGRIVHEAVPAELWEQEDIKRAHLGV
jgi:branched-chain amino acid transport system ATP-binding protein